MTALAPDSPVADARPHAASAAPSVVDVLEADPDLAAAATGSADGVASLPALAIDLPPGPWEPPRDARPDVLGLLVLSGLLIRRTTCGDVSCDELIGPGDLLRPWLAEHDGLIVPRASWEVTEPCRLALLNGNAVRLGCASPAVLTELLDRALARSRRQGVQNAIATATRIDDRVLLLFAHLAERWGRVNPDGVLIELPLKHAVIAGLVGARRPTVTSALSKLRDTGALRRCPSGWLLTESGRAGLARFR
jgi:CRP-like cAMP-binding protein